MLEKPLSAQGASFAIAAQRSHATHTTFAGVTQAATLTVTKAIAAATARKHEPLETSVAALTRYSFYTRSCT